jgi:hypothetical protein
VDEKDSFVLVMERSIDSLLPDLVEFLSCEFWKFRAKLKLFKTTATAVSLVDSPQRLMARVQESTGVLPNLAGAGEA